MSKYRISEGSSMTPQDLKSLGRVLRESRGITAIWSTVTKELKSKLDAGEHVVLEISKVQDASGLLKHETYKYKLKTKTNLKEEEVTVKAAEDLWAENAEAEGTYISNAVYYAKKIDGGQKFEVTVEDGTERKPFATLAKLDLDKAFTPIRPNQTPDAEGYTQYRNTDELDAFKYTEDTVKVDIGGEGLMLNRGDYLIRQVDGNNFKYEVKKAQDFEKQYTKK
jgi:hypothetical protein